MRQCMDMDNLHKRLKRVDGQIKAIDRMIRAGCSMRRYHYTD